MKVYLDKQIGKFKPINGASNFDASESGNFFDFGFPTVRLHDQDYPRPFCVDVAGIFPNFDKDENDPESYDFRHTDLIIKKLVENGIEVVYRLGNSIDHTPYKRLSCVPSDFGKWARIAEHIIAHYREGWADGFYYTSLKYFEIWNEPDLIYLGLETMWQGSEEDFFELYRITSRHLKARFPDVLIGGYGAARVRAPFFAHFLDMAEKEELPLDFFSWHRYGSEIEELRDQIRLVRELLDSHGYKNTISILDEWSYTENDFFGMNKWGLIEVNSSHKESFFSRMRGPAGASYIIGSMIMMLDEPVDMAHVYDCQAIFDFSLLFDRWHRLTKTAKAIRAFNKMARYERVLTENEIPDVYLTAGASREGAIIILSAFECKGDEEPLIISGCSGKSVKVRLINDYFDDEEVLTLKAEDDELSIPISLRPYNIVTIEVE